MLFRSEGGPSRLTRWLLMWGILALIAIVVTIKFGFLPNSPCDCGKAVTASLYTIDFEKCVYRGLYRSEQYAECSNLGQRCRDYMTARGVDCSGAHCGGPTRAELNRLDVEARIAQLDEEMAAEMSRQMGALERGEPRNLTRFNELSREQILLEESQWTAGVTFDDPFAVYDYYHERCG